MVDAAQRDVGEWLYKLAVARRHGDERATIDAVNTLQATLVPTSSPRTLASPEHHLDDVNEACRQALRWLVGEISWGDENLLVRTANASRWLRGPHPYKEERCLACDGTGYKSYIEFDGYISSTRCLRCQGRDQIIVTPEPDHAISIYFDAIKRLFSDWMAWFCLNSDWSYGGNLDSTFTYAVARHQSQAKDSPASVFSTGQIYCGPKCPPLPLVKLR